MPSVLRSARRGERLFGLLVLLLLPATATADATAPRLDPAERADEAQPAARPFRGPPQEPKVRVDLYQRFKLRADLDKGGASVAVYLSVRGTVGLVAYQEFEVSDRRGSTRYRSRTDPAPYFELLLALDF